MRLQAGPPIGPACRFSARPHNGPLANARRVRRRGAWRGGRAAEGARLESVCTGNRTAGSNPALSDTKLIEACGRSESCSGDEVMPPRREAALVRKLRGALPKTAGLLTPNRQPSVPVIANKMPYCDLEIAHEIGSCCVGFVAARRSTLAGHGLAGSFSIRIRIGIIIVDGCRRPKSRPVWEPIEWFERRRIDTSRSW